MNDIVMFSKQFLMHPTTVSSIVPSSKALSSTIIDKADLKNANVVFEFGCGSGAITKDIVKSLPYGSVFLTFDVNPAFTDAVKKKYPQAIVINDSVENAESYMEEYNIEKVDVIISSLPWAAFNHATQNRLIRVIHRILNLEGSFLTYAYIHTFVFPSQKRFKKMLNKRFKTIDISSAVWANIPPATVIKCIK